jgi:lipopolysaccharide transport system ATP-binding protein
LDLPGFKKPEKALQMSSKGPAVSVKQLGKRYEIYATPRDRLKQFTLPKLSKLFRQSSKRYFREFWALKDVSFDVSKGECFGVLGRNGAGKSTLLQILAGTLSLSEGSVQINGLVAALLELGSGFDPEFSGRENIQINASILGLSKAELEERFDEIVAFSEIGEFLDQPVKTYSSGMLMRLAFSTAIHVDPEILIVDEALAVGDYAFQHKCMLRIKQIIEKGVTVILVTHDVGAVMANCGRAMMLHNGIVQSIGSAADVCNRYLELDAKATLETLTTTDSTTDVSTLNPELPVHGLSAFNPVEPSYRWGTGQIQILGWQLSDAMGKSTNTFRFKDQMRISVLLQAKDPIESCFPGFMLSDRNGYHLTGITNRTCGTEIRNLKKGDQIILQFEVTLLFRADNYSVLLNIAADEYGTSFYDLCENAGNFSILDENLAEPPWGYGRTYLPTTLQVSKVVTSSTPEINAE